MVIETPETRRLFAEIRIDENLAEICAKQSGVDYAPIDWVEHETGGWLSASGISVPFCMVADTDDSSQWSRYVQYLIEWAFSHSDEGSEGMSPVCFDEWCDNEDCEEEPE